MKILNYNHLSFQSIHILHVKYSKSLLRILYTPIILAIVLSFFTLSSRAQNYKYQLESNRGFLWAHRESLRALQYKPVQGFDLSWNKTLDQKPWHFLYRTPELGIAYSFLQTGNPDIFGYGHSLSGSIGFPIIKSSKSQLSYQVRLGYGYLSKIFDARDNYYNIATGSHSNVFLRVSVLNRQKLFNNLALTTGLSLHHFSNTSFARPNLGLNFITFDLGLAFSNKVKASNPGTLEFDSPFSPYFELSFINGFGLKEIDPAGGRKYFTQSIVLNFERRISRKYQLGIGMDFFIDSSLKQVMKNFSYPTNGFSDYWRQGFHISYGVLYGKVLFNFQLGHYIFLKFNDDTPIYNRLALRYYFHPKWVFNLSLKAHFGRADFLELGFGYVIPFNNKQDNSNYDR